MVLKSVVIFMFVIVFLRVSAAQENPFVLWSVSPLVRVYKDSKPQDGQVGKPVVIKCARNEFEGGQFAITANTDLSNINVRLSELRHQTGYMIKPELLKWNFAGFIPLTKNTPGTSEAELERKAPFQVPDPLLDVQFVNLKSGESQPVWITVYVPEDAPAGEYNGNVTVSTSAGEASIKISLQVYPFALPQRRNLLVTNWFSPENIAKAHNVELWSEDFWEVFEKWLKVMSEHGQNVFWVQWQLIKVYIEKDGRLSFDYSLFDRYVETLLKAGRAERIEITFVAHHGEGGWGAREIVLPNISALERKTEKAVSLPPEKGLAKLLGNLQRHLEEKGWLERTMIHICDEPAEHNIKSWRKASEFVHTYAPKIKRIDAIETIGFEGALEIWVPKLSHLRNWFEHYKKAQAEGAELWFYTCCHPWGPYPNRFLDFPLIKTRILHWLNYAFNMTGYLHWGLNHWGKDPFGEPSPNLPPGDTHIIYPGKEGPLSSLRFEAMRDGLDDYEYLRLLTEKTKELQAKLGEPALKVPAERRSLELCRKIVKDFTDYEHNPDALLAVRDEIAKEIAQIGEPPLIIVATEPPEWAGLVEGPIVVLVYGVCEPESFVTVNGTQVPLNPDGSFSVQCAPRGDGSILIEAQKGSAKKTIEKKFEVVR